MATIQSVSFKKLNNKAIKPSKGSEDAAGYDLYSCSSDPIVIKKHQTLKIGTGIAIEIPKGYFGAIFARSGIATKRGLRPANCVGVIDSDYRGEIIIAIHNDGHEKQVIEPYERIAQLVLIPYLPFTLEEVQALNSTERGAGGFGSTGTH